MTSKHVFYHSLVNWDEMEALIAQLHPSEQNEARKMMLHSHDYLVHETILHHLDTSEHQTYLEKCLELHHDEGLLAWLESKIERIVEVLREVLKALKETLYEMLGKPQLAV
jgi:hypothetical protein